MIERVERAIQIAVEAHKGQTEKAGQPYILHLLRVMHSGKTTNEKICGVLHDLVEDTAWTFDDLESEVFSDEVINALECVAKTSETENYDDFISRVLSNPLAIEVKINDLKDNLDVTRLDEITEKDRLRLNKYIKSYRRTALAVKKC